MTRPICTWLAPALLAALVGCGDGPRRGPPPNAGRPSLEPTAREDSTPAAGSAAPTNVGDSAAEPVQPAPTRVDMPGPKRVDAAASAAAAEPQASTAQPAASSELRCKRLALALLLDRSGSMAGLPMQRAREAASAAVAELGDEDCVEVVSFDNEAQKVVSLRSASARGEIISAIAGIKEGGGTSYFEALEIASASLGSVGAKRKLVIMVTDGQAPSAGIPRLLEVMKRNKVAVSPIGLGQNADDKLLRQMATSTGGHAHQVRVADDLQKVVLREVREALKSAKK